MYLKSKDRKRLIELADDMWEARITLGAAAVVIHGILRPSKPGKQSIRWAEREVKKLQNKREEEMYNQRKSN